MPHYGFMANPSGKLVSEIRKARKLGADYIEIPFEAENRPDAIVRNKDKIKKVLDRYGLYCTIHMAYWADLGSEFTAVREAWRNECMLALNAAHHIGARKFLVHMRPQSGLSMLNRVFRKKMLSDIAFNIKRLNDQAKYMDMVFVLENEPFDDRIGFSDFISMARKTGSKAALDVGHAYIGGSNRKLRGIVNKLGRCIGHCHFSDNNGLGDEHLPIGRGSIDYEMVVREMKRIGYDGTITLEIFNGGERGFKSSMKKIKKIWEQSDN